jgi:hypothetical protein
MTDMHCTKTILRHYKSKTHGIKPYKQFIVEVNVTEYPRGKNGQSRETGNIEYTRRRKKRKKEKENKSQTKNTMCVGHQKAQTNTNTVNSKQDMIPQNNWR